MNLYIPWYQFKIFKCFLFLITLLKDKKKYTSESSLYAIKKSTEVIKGQRKWIFIATV